MEGGLAYRRGLPGCRGSPRHCQDSSQSLRRDLNARLAMTVLFPPGKLGRMENGSSAAEHDSQSHPKMRARVRQHGHFTDAGGAAPGTLD